ncbi:MAG TPA: ATP-binding protein [Acidimicrobiales bacterium]|jgi:two-component system sensor histidine kinase KdpD
MTPTRAALIGAAGTGALAILSAALQDDVGHPTQALLLVVPVVATAVVGGRHAAYAVAVVASLSFSLLLPPIGTPRVNITEDAVALAVFALVVLLIGALVASRVEAMSRVELHHAALLRAVSHDLRTPLASIQAVLSELEEPGLHDATARAELATMARAEAERLERLVSNLLSLARIEADALQLEQGPVDLLDLVDECASRSTFLLRGTELSVLGPPPGLPPVSGDHSLLEQVVVNLVENAVRHSPPGGVVTLSIGGNDQRVSLEVLDEGPGLSLSDLERIFEPFQTGSRPGTSGIGLAICKAVVDAHGGTLTASNRERGGASFRMELPVG